MSVNRKVTVPVGGLASSAVVLLASLYMGTIAAEPSRGLAFTKRAEAFSQSLKNTLVCCLPMRN
jgi:hypothetical protein